MPSRRSVLASCGLAAGTALSGCSAVTSPPGVPADIGGGTLDVPEAESAPIVARTEAGPDDDGCPAGLLRTEARVHEVDQPDAATDLVLVTEYDVITGESGCSSGWGQAGVTVRHDWSVGEFPATGRVTTARSNVVPTDGSGGRQATLERERTESVEEWRVHLTPPTKSTTTYRFASTFTGSGDRSAGDTLVGTRGEARVRNGWVGGSGELGTTTTLVYGETDR